MEVIIVKERKKYVTPQEHFVNRMGTVRLRPTRTYQNGQGKSKRKWALAKQDHRCAPSFFSTQVSCGHYRICSWKSPIVFLVLLSGDVSFLFRTDDWVTSIFSVWGSPSYQVFLGLWLNLAFSFWLWVGATRWLLLPRPLCTDLGPHGSPCQPTVIAT